MGVRSHVIITYCIAHEWGQVCLTTPTTANHSAGKNSRTTDWIAGKTRARRGRPPIRRLRRCRDHATHAKMPEQRWRRGEQVKRKYRPRPKGKCEETRYTEQRRSDYPISIVGNRTPQSLAALIDTILINQSNPGKQSPHSFLHAFIPSFIPLPRVSFLQGRHRGREMELPREVKMNKGITLNVSFYC